MNSATQDMKLRQSLLRQYHTKIVKTENSSTNAVQSRQAHYVRYCLKIFAEIWGNKDGDQAVYLPLTAEV